MDMIEAQFPKTEAKLAAALEQEPKKLPNATAIRRSKRLRGRPTVSLKLPQRPTRIFKGRKKLRKAESRVRHMDIQQLLWVVLVRIGFQIYELVLQYIYGTIIKQ
jgi:hypothetical protein